MPYECTRCGAEYGDNQVDDWGATEGTAGYGPEPMCTNLIENTRAAAAPDGSRPKQVCRGQLRYAGA